MTREVLVFCAAMAAMCGCSGSSTVTAPSGAPPASGNAEPPASAGHSLVYADHVGMVVLVNAGLGGATRPSASTATTVWGWTGGEWRALDSSGPPIRNLAGVAYDKRRQTLVMHGGSYDLSRSYGDTWEWSRGWRQVPGSNPGVRDHTQLAFDERRGRAVLFGGNPADPLQVPADTWEFDGSAWTRAATTGPSGRVHHAMAYDPISQQVVLFGGSAPGSGTLGDTWAWDGSRWTTQGSSGPPRSHVRMTFDRGLNSLVVAGGFMVAGADLLARRGTAWTPVVTATQPSARYLTDVAYDERRNVLVLFGGGDPGSSVLYADTWEFDGSNWRRVR